MRGSWTMRTNSPRTSKLLSETHTALSGKPLSNYGQAIQRVLERQRQGKIEAK